MNFLFNFVYLILKYLFLGYDGDVYDISSLPKPVELSFNKFIPLEMNSSLAPVIAIHGIYNSKESFDRLGKLLSKRTNRTFYSLTLRDHYGSPFTDEFSFKALLSDLINFIQENNFKRVNLVGHSLGGLIVSRYATMFPEMMENLVIIDIDPKKINKDLQTIGLLLEEAKLLASFIATVKLKNLNLRLSKLAMTELLKTANKTKESIRNLSNNLDTNSRNELIWKFNLPVLTKFIEELAKSDDFNPSFNGSTILVYGSESSLFDIKRDRKSVKSQFPNIKFRVLKGGTHRLLYEYPQKFLNILVPFLNK